MKERLEKAEIVVWTPYRAIGENMEKREVARART